MVQPEELLKEPANTAMLPNVRLRPAGGKRCIFMCGSIFGQTPDPLQESRPAIRWAYEKSDPCSEPNDQGLKGPDSG